MSVRSNLLHYVPGGSLFFFFAGSPPEYQFCPDDFESHLNAAAEKFIDKSYIPSSTFDAIEREAIIAFGGMA